jgi:hypothetical protein
VAFLSSITLKPAVITEPSLIRINEAEMAVKGKEL